MAPSLLILQPTPYCNLDCSYCYLKRRDDRSRMSDDVLRAVAHNILAPCSATQLPTVLWHAGEPMALRSQWYEHAFALLENESGHKGLQHAFQTNAVGVNDDWLDLWEKWSVEIGISIDGPKAFHDLNRKTRSGAGSFELVMSSIGKIKQAGLPFSIISVLTAESLKQPDKLYDFYLSEGLFDVAFNVEEYEGQDQRSSLHDADTAEAAYYAFLRRFMERMDENPGKVTCREVDVVREIISRPHVKRRQNGLVDPFDIITVCADGGMLSYSPELAGATIKDNDDFIFGNVLDGGVDQFWHSRAFRASKHAIELGVARCAATCAYFDVCGGGAPANKFFELGDLAGTETTFCRLTVQTALNAVLDALEDSLPQTEPAARKSGT